MQHLIQLRTYLDSLSNNEYIELFADFIQDDRDTFNFMLFDYLINHHSNPDKKIRPKLNVHALNAKAKQIINSRNVDFYANNNEIQNFNHHQKEFHFSDLSQDLIATISSNLDLNDHISFEKCNRRTFITLRSFPLSTISITLNEKNLINYLKQQKSIGTCNRFKALKHVTIDAHDDDNVAFNLSKYKVSELDLQLGPFNVLHNDYDYTSIKRLMLFVTQHTEPDDVLDFLIECSNIEYLDLEVWESFESYPRICDIQSFQRLKGFCSDLNDYFPVVKAIRHLESLHVHSMTNIDAEDVSNLKELCWKCSGEDSKQLNPILNGCKQLERVHLSLDIGDADYSKDIFIKLFSLKSVNYISICPYGDESSAKMLDILNFALSQQPKPRMKIRLNIGLHVVFTQFEKQLIQLIKTIHQHIMGDFMVLFDLQFYGDNKISEISAFLQWVQKLKEKVKNMCSISLTYNDDLTKLPQQLVILNNHCHMNGYQEKWLFTCVFCQNCRSI